jgi:hypothetical protein
MLSSGFIEVCQNGLHKQARYSCSGFGKVDYPLIHLLMKEV